MALACGWRCLLCLRKHDDVLRLRSMPSLEPRWLCSRDVADYISVRVGDLARLVRRGTIPGPSHALGLRQPRWDRQAIDLCMQGHPNERGIDEAVQAIVQGILSKPSRRRRAADL